MTTKKTKVISFRVPEEEANKIEEIIKNSDLSRSEFFRHFFFSKQKEEKVIINVTKKERNIKNKDYSKLVFYYNKSSNNLNQLAKQINTYNKNGLLSDNLFLLLLTKIDTIEKLLFKGVNNGYNKS